MKTKCFVYLSLLIGWISLISCTLSPWHRDQADAYMKKGRALLEAGQYLGALTELLEADKYAPNDPEINYYLGLAYSGRGLTKPAMERMQKAVDLKKDYSEAHNHLGVLYMDMGQWEKAIACFDRALDNYLYSTPALALYNSGWAYYNLKNYDTALSRYHQALRQDRMRVLQPQIEKNIALVYIKRNDLVSAVDYLKRAVAQNANLLDAHFFLAECYYQLHDFQNAKKSFQQVVKLAPQSPFAQKAQEYLRMIESR
jgi:tetratricopeptide (TPR) repeat protein